MRIAIFGTGLMARVRAQQLLADPRVSWVGLGSTNTARADVLAGQIGAAFSGSIDDTLAQRPDALVVAGSSNDHAHHIRLGLNCRIPVFSEKPLATDLADCRAIVSESETMNIGVQVGFQRRFDTQYADAKALLDQGQLGRLYSVRLTSHDHQPPPEHFVSTSGGLFRDLGVHDYDLARWITQEEVTQVYVAGTNRTEWDYFAPHDDVDIAVTVLTMESGLPVVVSSSRHSPDGQDVRAELYGSQHNVTVGHGGYAPLRSSQELTAGKPLESYENFLARFQAAFDLQTIAFVDWVNGDIANPCPATNGLESLRIAVAADTSCRERRPVRMTEI